MFDKRKPILNAEGEEIVRVRLPRNKQFNGKKTKQCGS